MKFIVDCRVLSQDPPAGVAVYTMSLIDSLLDEGYTVRCLSNKKIRLHRSHARLAKQEHFLFSWLPGTIFILLFSHLFVGRRDIFIGANHTIPFFGQFLRLPIIHDFNFKLVPETQTFSNKFFQHLSVMISLVRCKKIAFVSEYTRQIAMEYKYLRHDHKTLILPNIPQKINVSERTGYKPKKKFILCLGSLEPRKNLSSVLDLFPEFGVLHDIELILIGPSGWKNKSINSLLGESNLTGMVNYLGYLPRSEIGWYLHNCEVFCMPSRYEGFGIPQFEALLLNSKVIGSKHSELRFYEHCNNVWLFDYKTDDLEQLLVKAISSVTMQNTYKPRQLQIDRLIEFLRHDLL